MFSKLQNARMPNKKQINQPHRQLEGGPKQGVAEAAALVDMNVSTIKVLLWALEKKGSPGHPVIRVSLWSLWVTLYPWP